MQELHVQLARIASDLDAPLAHVINKNDGPSPVPVDADERAPRVGSRIFNNC